jgi:hypothetical protein
MDPEVKSQPVRLLDVFVIGPLMIWGGYALDDRGEHYGAAALVLFGLSTIVYNARNYEIVRRRNEARRG